ncbi:MAG: cytochrome c [Campylobacterales bacterium]
MKKQLILAGLATATMLLVGCGGDKKVEERVAQIQSNAPVTAEANTSVTAAPKSEVAAATPVDGKGIYVSKCSACHGQNGEGKATYPKLAGNSKDDAMKKLKGYVDGTYGKAQKMIMAGQAKSLSDADKAAVSEYIATLK